VESFSRDGLTFPVRDVGTADGPTVVLLHGFPGSSETWSEVVGPLAQEGLRLLAPDQRGYSPDARPPGRLPYRIAEMVADVLALIDATGKSRVHLVGHDWGAVVGWATAAAHPDRLSSLTALATPHPGAMRAALRRGDQALRSAYVGLFWLPAVPERILLARGGAGLRALLAASGLSAPWREKYTTAMLEPGALTGALAWYRALPPAGPAPAAGRIAVPTCFVAAAGDTTASPAAVSGSADFVDGPYRFEQVKTSHWLPEDHPALVARLITETITAADRGC
jgi:pimeloyl-ACP methyl ester carboxylesterase